MIEKNKNIKLGLFVILGTVLLITALYIIGSKQSLFGNTISIKARFQNVNGLMKGNNVRFSGIDVGTVESVNIISDSAVEVVMLIEKDAQLYIKKNAVASVGSDGLMGNKLVNINSVPESAESIEDDDVIKTFRPLEMDEMMRTLNVTNENIMVISSNLRNVTDRLNNKNSLWNILMDTMVAENVKSSIVNLKVMSNNGVLVMGDLRNILGDVKSGKGTLGALITDTLLSSKVKQIVVKFDRLSDTAAVITGDLKYVIKGLKEGRGTMGVLLNDTSLIHNLNKSVETLNTGAGNFNQNMEALKYTWPFKKYFKKKKK